MSELKTCRHHPFKDLRAPIHPICRKQVEHLDLLSIWMNPQDILPPTRLTKNKNIPVDVFKWIFHLGNRKKKHNLHRRSELHFLRQGARLWASPSQPKVFFCRRCAAIKTDGPVGQTWGWCHRERWFGDFHSHGGAPKWMVWMVGEIPSINGWWLGVLLF